MVLAKGDLSDICDGLLYNFLYNSDIDSIHILLNLYDIEINMINLYPKYRCTKEIRKRIRKVLFPRKNRQLISNNLSMLLHEDIDRLELSLYLEGYKDGYYDNKWVNIIEDEAIDQFSVEELYGKSFLFHYDIYRKDIYKIVKDFNHELDLKEKKTSYLHNIIDTYCQKVIKKKIYDLNLHIDKQLAIDYDMNKLNIQEEESMLSMRELNNIYKAVIRTINNNMINTYKEAYWFGINDRVLNRYS